MKKKILYILAFALSGVITTSCTDELEQVNPNEISTDSFWKNLDDCDKGMVGIYNAFKSGSIMQLGAESNRADITWPGWGRPNTTNEYYLQTFTDASQAPNQKWAALYTGVFRANQVIEALDRIKESSGSDLDEVRWSYLYGQARFFRGLFYFYLHNSFNQGSVIIHSTVPEKEEDFFKPLSPAEDVFNFFMTDLQEAYKEGMLPARWEGINLGRVTRGTAAAVIGKAYLYAGDYEAAKPYFEDVINNYHYRLVDVDMNMTTHGEFNDESILEVSYSAKYKLEESVWGDEGMATINANATSPIGGWRGVLPSSWLIMAYKEDPIDRNDPRNLLGQITLPAVDGSDSIVNIYRNYSLRTSYSIALADDEVINPTTGIGTGIPIVGYYQKTTAQKGNFNNLETAYYRKQTNWDIYETEKDQPGTDHSGVNVRVIRLADVYLMYAECLIEGGGNDAGVDEAIKYINRVRHRSALQLIGTSANSEFPSAEHNETIYMAGNVMDHLMFIERPLELAYEGHAIRTIDLRRWGITKAWFQELSTRQYYGETFETVDDKGKQLFKWGALLNNGPNVEYPNNTIVDYLQAASNYNESAHAYWPIPNSEAISNPKLYGN